MLKKLKQLNNKGFTIIEVLIVLAIAGLILLIVFLAVPALQRNSRNTQTRSEAAKLLSVTSEWMNNNNGDVPNKTATPITCAGTGGASGNCDYTTSPTNAMQIWQLSNSKNIVNVNIPGKGTTTAITMADTKTINIVSGVTCPTMNNTATTPALVAGPERSIIAVYAIESSTGGPVAQCTSS